MTDLQLEQRQQVVREVRSWIGTAFHHMGAIKVRRDDTGRIVDAGGTDCAMVIYHTYRACNLIPALEIPYYPRDWHLNRSAERYLNLVSAHAYEIPEADAKMGDMVLYRWGRAFAHGAIIVDPGWPHVVHALYEAGMVLEDFGNGGKLADRPRKFFTIWGR